MEQPVRRKYKRKIIMINREFQNKLIARVMIPISIIVIAMGVVFYIFANQRLEEGEYWRLLQIENLRKMLLPFIVGLTLVMLVISNVYAYVTFLYTSHRIAGPMFRFSRSFEELARGNLDLRLHLREKDEMVDLQDQFNVMLEFFNLRLREAQDHARQLSSRVEALTARTYEEGARFDARKALTEIMERTSALSRELSQFRVRR